MFAYTIFHTNGDKESYKLDQEYSLKEKQQLVGGYIEAIPVDYWPDDLKGSEGFMFGHEEERFKDEYTVNPHFKDLGGGWNVVGTIVFEQEIK